jgi:hypothetical protein
MDSEEPVPVSFTLGYFGELYGFQKPCNCAAGQTGGLLRLGSAVRYVHKRLGGTAVPAELSQINLSLPDSDGNHPLWLVDCGNFTDLDAHYPLERVKTHLSVLAELTKYGMQCAVPGSAELQLEAESATAALGGSPVPLVACNLTADPEQIRIYPYIALAEGWYLTGVSSWLPQAGAYPKDRWWELSDPVAAVEQVLEGLPEDAQLIVVSIYQPGEVARSLAALPIAMLIGFGSQHDRQWQDDFAPSYPKPVAKAQHVQFLSCENPAAPAADNIRSWKISLGEEWPDYEPVQVLLDREQELIAQRLREDMAAGELEGWKDVDWGQSDKFLPEDRDAKLQRYLESDPLYVGTKECNSCHPQALKTWETSRHATALHSLIKKGENHSLDCLGCHVAGLLKPSGFNPADPNDITGAVTCENCHGPASVHIARAGLGKLDLGLGIERYSTGQCVECHDPYNSPEFDEQHYWEAIEH